MSRFSLASVVSFFAFVSSVPYDIESFGAVAGVDTRSVALTNGLAIASALSAANASSSASDRSVLVRSDRNYSYLPSVSSIGNLADVTFYIEGRLELN